MSILDLAQIQQAKQKVEAQLGTVATREQTPFERRAAILTARGIPVAPLPPRTKIAALKNWEVLATSDAGSLSALNPDPDGNTAAVARAEIGGFCFFEVDKPNFHKQIEQETRQKFPTTFIVSSSPGKGRGHFYFLHTEKSIALGNAQAADSEGEIWSFRGDRRYVVGPQSVKDAGEVYTVINDAPIVEIPDWLVEYCAKSKVEKKSVVEDTEDIVEGNRNNALTSILGKARQQLKMDREELYQFGLSVNHKRCRPPLPDSEVRTISDSVGGYAVKESGQLVFETPSSSVTAAERPIESESINPVESSVNSLDYLPSTVLASTRLQDIYLNQFYDYDWPLTLALPALVTAGSVVVPFQPRGTDSFNLGSDDAMTNLYTALIAEVHAGKSQITKWAARAIGIHDDSNIGSHYFEGKWGSAEQMLKSLHKKQGTFTSKSVLLNPDEWAHLFRKAAIPDASFPTVLTTSFYRRNQIFTLGGPDGGREYNLNLQMSFIGGIVEEEFDTVFGSHSLGGLYDRFLFGRAPEGFMWNYQPCPIEPGKHFAGWNLKPVQIDGSVYEVTKQWNKENPGLGRVSEMCTRIANIYGSLDGRPEITGKDIEPLKPLALYQIGLRQMFRPNPGQNPDAVFANKALAWVQKHAGEWTSIARLKQHTWRVEQNLGPAVAVRSLIGLARSGRIDLWLPDGGRELPRDYQGPVPKIGLVRRVK
jgi:hypothetical protein